MPGRNYSTEKYRYAINGQEKSQEIGPNTTTAEFWQYDARIVRRWNVDPRPSVEVSVYAAFGNNPIVNSDPLGDTTITRPDGVKDDMPEFGKVNSLSTPGNVAGTNVPAQHTEGAVESFTIGNRTFRAHYYAPTGTFTGYKCGDLYYNYKSYMDAVDAVGDYDLAGSLINSGYTPEQLIDVARRNAAMQAYLNRSPVRDFFKGIFNDIYVTGRTMLSGPLGLSKTGFSDLDGNSVGYNQRISAGLNTFSMMVPMGYAEAGAARASNSFIHYTTEAGYNSIIKTGELLPSIGAKNARFGTGQYFTDIIPGQFTRGQTSRRLFGVPWVKTKLTHFIEVDAQGLNMLKNANHNYMVPGTSGLNIADRIISHGTTGF